MAPSIICCIICPLYKLSSIHFRFINPSISENVKNFLAKKKGSHPFEMDNSDKIYVYLALILRARVGYNLAIIISCPTERAREQ